MNQPSNWFASRGRRLIATLFGPKTPALDVKTFGPSNEVFDEGTDDRQAGVGPGSMRTGPYPKQGPGTMRSGGGSYY